MRSVWEIHVSTQSLVPITSKGLLEQPFQAESMLPQPGFKPMSIIMYTTYGVTISVF